MVIVKKKIQSQSEHEILQRNCEYDPIVVLEKKLWKGVDLEDTSRQVNLGPTAARLGYIGHNFGEKLTILLSKKKSSKKTFCENIKNFETCALYRGDVEKIAQRQDPQFG